MDEGTDDAKAYGEREVGAILRRAAELQASKSDASHADGITLEEFERAAADVGIDPQFVRAAAAERGAGSSLSGVVELRRDVPAEVKDDEWEEMVAELVRAFGLPGQAQRSARGYVWELRHDPDPENRARIRVSVRPRNGRTEIEITSAVGKQLVGAWVASLIGGLLFQLYLALPLISSGNLSEFPGPLLAAGIIAPTLFAGHLGIKSWLRKERQKLDRVLDRLAACAGDSAVEHASRPTFSTSEQEVQPLNISR